MKKIFLTTAVAFVITSNCFSQCPSNGTHTDPNPNLGPSNGGATPANSGYKTNTFDWKQNLWNHYVVDINGNAIQGQIASPFWSNQNYLAQIHNGANSDFMPESGWELIKQDMGYFYSNNQWDGQPMGLNNANDPRNSPSYLNYLVLYNKYSSLLRVVCFIPDLNGINGGPVDKIFVNLSFEQSFGTHTFYPNALFNNYNGVMKALDKQTKVTTISSPASCPSTSSMFYADFQLSYDPCVCLFESGMVVTFNSIQSYTLQAHGMYAGVNSTDLAAISNSQGHIYGDGTNYLNSNGENFIASIFANGASPQGMIQSYNDATALANDANNAPSGSPKDGLEALATALDIAAAFASDGATAATEPATHAAFEFTLKSGLEAGAKAVDFFSGRIKDDNSTTKPQLSLSSGYISLTGNVSLTNNYTGFEARFGTPGSKNSNQLSEYTAGITGGTVPDYPIYNEPLGLFALLKTPVVKEYKHSPSQSNYGEINFARNGGVNPPNGSSSGSGGYGYYYTKFYYGDKPTVAANAPCLVNLPWCSDLTERDFSPPTTEYFTLEYHMDEDLVYAVSPLVDLTKSNIYVALEIDGKPMTNGSHGVYSWKPGESKGFEDLLSTSGSFIRQRTPFYPLSCITNIYTSEKYNYEQSFVSGNFDDQNYCPSWSENSYICNYKVPEQLPNTTTHLLFNNPDLALFNNPRNVRLVVLLDLVSVPDAYGKVHFTSQILKYDCNITPSSTDFALTSAGAAALSAVYNSGQDLVIPATTYSNPQDIFSFGKIAITGNQTNNAPNNGVVNIAAEKEIDVNGNIAFHGNINLYTQGLPNYFNTACPNTPLSPLSGTNLTSYCQSGYNGSQYMANQVRAIASTNQGPSVTANASKPVTATKLGRDIKLGIFPNPTTGLVYLNMSAQKTGAVIVSITDVNGQLVSGNTYNAEVGANSFKLELGNLQNGVYAIRVSDDAGNIIKQDKVILTK